MSTRPFRVPGPSVSLLLVVVLASGLLACDEETVGPETRGSLDGTVENAETGAPIPRANVTTSPPTQSVLTDENGRFSLGDIPTGNYTVTASKSDFASRSVTVRVAEGQTTSASILLETKAGTGADSLTAKVTNWFNDRVNRDSTGPDSIFVDVEYSAENVGDVRIQNYEVYFDIETAEGTFSREIAGDSLDTGRRDIGGFRKHIPVEAQSARVNDVYWETSSD